MADGVKRTNLAFAFPFAFDVGTVTRATDGTEEVWGRSVGVGAGIGRASSVGGSESVLWTGALLKG